MLRTDRHNIAVAVLRCVFILWRGRALEMAKHVVRTNATVDIM